MATLPNAPYYRYRYRVTLGATEYLLKFHYATFSGRWSLTIATRDDSADLASGISVVYGLNLLAPNEHLVPGTLTITPTDPRASHPTFESLADDLERLTYVS